MLDDVTSALTYQHVIMATMLQFKTKELFVGSKITNTRSQDNPPEQGRGRHQNTMTIVQTIMTNNSQQCPSVRNMGDMSTSYWESVQHEG